MSVQTKHFLQRYGLPIGAVVVFGAATMLAGHVFADVDLSDGVSTATSSFKSIIKTAWCPEKHRNDSSTKSRGGGAWKGSHARAI